MSLSVEEYRACARGKIASSYSWGFEYASLIRFHGFATEDADALDVRGLLADPEFDYTSAEKKLRGIGEANLVVAHTGGVVPEVDAILAGTKCSMENLRECAEDSGRILQAFSDFERKPRSLALDDLRSSPLAVIGVNLKDGPVFGFLPR